ncbi:MAG: 1-acyl-sn-glycerol-3-phosphate acyltransferase, partial [Saprospiraceae bacterium]|nr:1-acyl-sn-glycerol-3-phosphate acyltransferase [Saprospiraceae bacterium]
MKEKLQLYPHILPNLEDWPIYKLSVQRRDFIKEINRFTLERFKDKYQGDFDELLAKTVYQERIRIRSKPWRVDRPDEQQFWTKVYDALNETSTLTDPKDLESAQIQLLARIIARYSDEIVGSFVPKTYLQARRILTAFFKRLLSKYARTAKGWGKKEQLYHRIKIYGPIEMIRELARKGTVILVPTHFSNLDSLLIGYAVDAKVGLPSFSYGAGLNLYNFGPAAYFMNRLGAYRVDRRKKNPVYLETLKSMSNLSIQKGTHSLFFPGGTRSRSGKAESKLKLGLLGTAIEAQRAICEKQI